MAININFLGTGGIIEGNLGEANVNVNLDSALKLDGSADYLKNATANFRSSDSSGFITAWVNSDDWNRGTQQHIFSATDEATGNFYIRTFFNSDGKLYIKCMDSSVIYDLKSTNAVTDDGNWHHIAVGSTGSAIKMYIDGVEETVVVDSGTNNGDWFGDLTASKIDHAIVGALHDNAGVRSMFDGFIADVRYYSDTLDIDEIKLLASKINGTTPTIDNLQHWWKLNSNTIDATNLGLDSQGSLNLTPNSIGASDIYYDQYCVYVSDAHAVGSDKGVNMIESLTVTEAGANIDNGEASQFQTGEVITMADSGGQSGEFMKIGLIEASDGTKDILNFTARGAGGTTAVSHDNPSDIYKANTTTTNGAVTITKGKLECLSLSSLTTDGNGDFITGTDSFASIDSTDTRTMAGWVFLDDANHNAGIFGYGKNSAGANQIFEFYNYSSGLSIHYGTNNSGGSTDLDTGKWYHIAATYDGSKTSVYINGILDHTDTRTIATDPDFIHIGSSNYATTPTASESFNGHIRDVRLYDFNLSDDQIFSLYSGTYNATPLHWWKLDEGAGSTANDSGTGSVNITSFSGNSDLDSRKGTLDLDGNLTIAAEGTLSAPRGDLSLASATTFAANTFVHNNGRVVVTNAGTVEYRFSSDNAGSDNPLYDFQNQATGQVRFLTGYIIENSHSHSGGNSYNYLTSNRTYNYGTTSSAASITTLLRSVVGTDSSYANIYGVSSLHPVNISVWDDTPLYTNVAIKNVNITTDITQFASTSNGNRIVRLDGDCEFDAVTVDSGDRLDINGQRAEFSGTLDVNGTIYNTLGSSTIKGQIWGNAIQTTGSNNAVHCDLISDGGYFDADQTTYNTIFMRSGTHTIGGTRSWSSSPLIVGGTTNFTSTNTWGDITMADGGSFTGNDETINCGGDFKTSGGLIGKTGLYLNGLYEVQFDGSNAAQQWDSGASANGTVEGWFKADAFSYDVMARSYNNGKWMLLMNSGDLQFMVTDNSNVSKTISATHGLSTDQWFHVAGVCDGTSQLLYINGKLVASETKNAGLKSATGDWAFGKNPDDTTNNYRWDGHIHQFRVWKEARTVNEIRTNMFTSTPTDTNSKLAANINFEVTGSGTSVVTDAEGNGNGVLRKWDGSATVDTTDTEAWATSGTFDKGTDSTVNMTGADGKLYLGSNGYMFDNLGLAPSGGTTTLTKVGGHTNMRVYKTLTHNGGTFAQSGNMSTEILGSGTVSAGATIPYICYWGSSTNVPTSNYNYFIANTGTVTFAGNCTFAGYWRTNNKTIIGGAFSHSVRSLVIDASGTFDLRNTTVTMTGTTGSTNFNDPNSTFITGNTTITGHASRTYWTSPAAAGHEIVGDVSNLNFQAGNDLTVIGSISNCIGTGFRQWTHTMDTQQMLDADSGGSDDIRLEKPALDNTHEIKIMD